VDVAPGKQPYDPRFKEVLALVQGRQVQFDLLLNGMKPSDSSVDHMRWKYSRDVQSGARIRIATAALSTPRFVGGAD